MSVSKSEITRHLSKDPILKPLLDSIPFPVLKVKETPLSEALVESIVYQQLSIKAAAVIYKRLLAKFDDEKLDLKKLTRLKTETLRGVGLSYAKADYVRNIASFFLLPENMNVDWHRTPEDELISRLTTIKGVGKWTVQMVMISTMARLDVFPVLDLGVQQGIKKLYGLKDEGKLLIEKMHSISVAWQPYRTIGCLYLWRWKDGK